MPRRIKVKGITRSEMDVDTIAHVYFVMGKRAVEEKRRRDAAERERRNRKGGRP